MNGSYNALLDTSAVVGLEHIDSRPLARRLGLALSHLKPTISTITLAELAAAPHLTANAEEQAARQARLEWAETCFEPLPFDVSAARAYGYLSALTCIRPEQRATVQVAAVAMAYAIPLVTRCPEIYAEFESQFVIAGV